MRKNNEDWVYIWLMITNSPLNMKKVLMNITSKLQFILCLFVCFLFKSYNSGSIGGIFEDLVFKKISGLKV